MNAIRRLLARLSNFATRRRDDERLKEEIEFHIAAQAEENIRAGMTAEEARRRARLKFGSVETVREEYHAEKGLPFLENILFDIRYAFRVLRKAPAFSIVVILTLMLVIGTNVVVFGVLNSLLLQPLEVSDPESLYQVRTTPRMSGGQLTTSYPAFEDFRRRNTTFSGMAATYGYSHAALRSGNAVMKVRGYEVTGNYFDLLGVQPALGRLFHAMDDQGPNSAPYVVLSDHLWRSAFNADRAILGTNVQLNNHPFEVIGVASPRFHGTERFERPDYWIPILNAEQVRGWNPLQSRSGNAVMMIGRLKPGVTLQEAIADLNRISVELAKEFPKTDRPLSVRLIRPGLFGDDGEVIGRFLTCVAVLAFLLLAAACANLANLFAARVSDRSRELALRIALGSGRLWLLRQLVIEAAVVSLLGGTAGLLGAHLVLEVLNRWHPSFGYGGQRLAISLDLDARLYVAGLVLTLGSALLFGLISAWQAWQSSPLQVIKGGSTDSTHPRRFALRDLLLGAQIATCTLLVVASFVAARGMTRALDAPLGFKPEGAMLIDVDLRQAPQEEVGPIQRQRALIEAALSIPSVTAAAVARSMPMGGGMRGVPVYRLGTTEFIPQNQALATRYYPISPGYLEAAGTRLLHGRDFSWRDNAESPDVAIVNETFAKLMWSDTTAIGQRFHFQGRETEVVGVAEDGKYHDLMESPQPALFVSLSQRPGSETVLVVRSPQSPNEMAATLQRTLSRIEPHAPITVRSWPDALNGALFPARAAAVVLGFMGAMAAILAVTGLFGLAAYSVSRRMKELGIRMALGAQNLQVMTAALGRPIILLGVGSALGLVAGTFASRLLRQIVYQADPTSPTVLASTVLTMALIGLAGSAIPAWRALKADPSKLMREQ